MLLPIKWGEREGQGQKCRLEEPRKEFGAAVHVREERTRVVPWGAQEQRESVHRVDTIRQVRGSWRPWE